jgi:hypothetical protein
MDDKEKSLFDSFADTIKHTFDIATEAASKALEPEPLKPGEELVVVPTPPDAFVSDLASPIVAIVKKKPRKKSGVDTSGRITPDYDIPLPDTPMPSPKKAAKKISKKPARKAAKKSVPKVAEKVTKKSKKVGKKSISKKTVKKQRRSINKKRKAKRS